MNLVENNTTHTTVLIKEHKKQMNPNDFLLYSYFAQPSSEVFLMGTNTETENWTMGK